MDEDRYTQVRPVYIFIKPLIHKKSNGGIKMKDEEKKRKFPTLLEAAIIIILDAVLYFTALFALAGR